jgi:hypothetical protein
VLRPRTPEDCGLCQAEVGPTDGSETAGQCERVVRPWAEVKSRRGRRKRAEGLDSSAAGRVFGYREETIRTWLARGGGHAAQVHKHFFHHLFLGHAELDESRTTLRDKAHELWVWGWLWTRAARSSRCCAWEGGRERGRTR